jgi:hypothetical protein
MELVITWLDLKLFDDVILLIFFFFCDLFIDAVTVPCYKPGLYDENFGRTTLGSKGIRCAYVCWVSQKERPIFLEVIVVVIVK